MQIGIEEISVVLSARLVPPRPTDAAAPILRIEPFAAKSDAEFLGVLRVCEAIDHPPLVLVEHAVMPSFVNSPKRTSDSSEAAGILSPKCANAGWGSND